ncbi:M48 family metallopeptidase [Solirubrobacter taibaiensis]|nr:M48 family metallopeptidase [Solirubrobacter taibaiensis]
MASTPIPSTAGPSLAGRYAAAIALTIGFYVLALIIGGGLIAAPIYGWANGTGNIWLTITALFLGGSILFAIVPRRLKFETPGLRVTEAEQPELLRLVAEEAKAAGEPMPDDVYLTLEANAAVTQASRSRRALIVGVPLLHILSERELRGVIAHEFGHYSGGDTKLGPWIYRTRETIIRTVLQLSDDEGDEGWSQRAVRKPFIWYGNAFLRITAKISRRQEFAADRCAVASVGRAAYAAGLERVHAYGPAFDSYWGGEVAPLLGRGHRPAISEGFSRFIAHQNVAEAADTHLERLRDEETDPYDSHPSLPERLAAIDGLPAGDPDESRCSIELLRDPAGVERAQLQFLFGADIEQLSPIEWDAVGPVVYGARARELTQEFPRLLEGVTVGTLPEAVARRGDLAARITDPEIEDREELALVVLADATLLALEAAGWTIVADLAEPISARRGDTTLFIHAAIGRMAEGELSAEQWEAEARELGIADVGIASSDRQEVAA